MLSPLFRFLLLHTAGCLRVPPSAAPSDHFQPRVSLVSFSVLLSLLSFLVFLFVPFFSPGPGSVRSSCARRCLFEVFLWSFRLVCVGLVRSSCFRLGSFEGFPLLVLSFRLRRVQLGILLQVLSTLRFLDRFRLSLGSVLFVSVVFVLSHCGFLSLVFTWGLFLVLSPGSAVVLGGPVLPSSPAASPPFGGSTSPCFLLCLHFFLWLTFFHTEAGGECRGFPRFFLRALQAPVFLLVPRSSSRREEKSVSGACCHAHFLEAREYGEGGGMLSPANFG